MRKAAVGEKLTAYTISELHAPLIVREVSAPHTPSDSVLERIEKLWSQELRSRPELHDGKIFSIHTLKTPEITVWCTQYKWWIAQRVDRTLLLDLGVRPLAVCSLLVAKGHVAFARRSPAVTQFPNQLELGPSGGVDETCRQPDSSIDVLSKLLDELCEEFNVSNESILSTRPFAIVEDLWDSVYDIVFYVNLNISEKTLQRLFHARESGESPTSPISVGSPSGSDIYGGVSTASKARRPPHTRNLCGYSLTQRRCIAKRRTIRSRHPSTIARHTTTSTGCWKKFPPPASRVSPPMNGGCWTT